MPTKIEAYKTPLEHNPTPTHQVIINDPPFNGQEADTLYDVKVTVFHTPKGNEVFASQSGRKYEGHIEPDSNEKIIFPQSHGVVIISKY